MKIKAPKDKVIKLYKQRYSSGEIARKFGISTQRVHQIVKGYQSFATSVGDLSRYPRLVGKPCQRCGGPQQVIHHVDGNSSNNAESNLIPLCKLCHTAVHKEMRKELGKSRKTICANL
jgi:hypothetical protein